MTAVVTLVVFLTGVAVTVGLGQKAADDVRDAHRGQGLGAGPTLATSPDLTPTCVNAPAGWLTAEATRTGQNLLPPDAFPVGIGPVVGYLDRSSTVCGHPVGLHLAASGRRPPVRVQVQALRVGAYPGGPTRVVWKSPDVTVRRQPNAQASAGRTTVVATWSVALAITPTSAWPPGLYLLRIFPVDAPARASYVPLRIRTNGARAPRLVISSDLTELAYDDYGGISLYGRSGTTSEVAGERAYTASADRPLHGSGLQQVFSMEVPLARLLDEYRLDADWTTDSSYDADPAQAAGYPSIVLPGHSEYWTKRMYDALAAQVGAGTNLAVLGANEIYWQTRLHRDAAGRLTGMTVFRDRSIDPVVDRSLTTTQWRMWPLQRDPAALTGEGMAAVGIRGDYRVVSAPGWLFRGTSLHPGDRLVDAVGNEADAVEPAGGHSPANAQVVLSGQVVPPATRRTTLVTAAYYSAPSGAGVFAAGTTFWLCGAAGRCPTYAPPPRTRAVLAALTVNVLRAFARPAFGAIEPSRTVPALPLVRRSVVPSLPLPGPLG